MDKRLEHETAGLIKSWERHDERMLRDYLVADVEDPRLNIQSILSRHFLVEAMFGDRFAPLMEHELRFGLAANWMAKLQKMGTGAEEFPVILYALQNGADNAEGLPLPAFLSQTFARLPAAVNDTTVPNYLRAWLNESNLQCSRTGLTDEPVSTFQSIWRNVLEKEAPPGLAVLEPACGSANDYRFLEAFGLARLLDYTGFDLSEKNVRNAREMFPAARFNVGNAFQIQAADQAFDLCFVHDLFEHLSLEGLAAAVAEICRVTRRGICAGFFSMHEETDHIVRPVEDYHWNTLSAARTRALFERAGFNVQVVHIGTFLKWQFGCDETHNQNAYTFVAHRNVSTG